MPHKRKKSKICKSLADLKRKVKIAEKVLADSNQNEELVQRYPGKLVTVDGKFLADSVIQNLLTRSDCLEWECGKYSEDNNINDLV